MWGAEKRTKDVLQWASGRWVIKGGGEAGRAKGKGKKGFRGRESRLNGKFGGRIAATVSGLQATTYSLRWLSRLQFRK